MERIRQDGDNLETSLVFHPDSIALQRYIQDVVRQELAHHGIEAKDAHELRNDLELLRGIRESRSKIISIVGASALLSILTAIGTVIVVGIRAWIKDIP